MRDALLSLLLSGEPVTMTAMMTSTIKTQQIVPQHHPQQTHNFSLHNLP